MNTMPSVAKRRIALVGAGQMGANHARTVFRSEKFELAYVVDAELNRAASVADSFSATAANSIDAITNVDAAIIATSTASHLSIANELLSLGLPLLIEKPVTPNVATTSELVETSRRYGIPIQCGFVERFNPAFVTARKMLRQPVIHAHAIRHSPPATRIASGVAEDLLIHDIDLALTLTEHAVSRVTGHQFVSPETCFAEITDCLLLFGDSAVFSLSASRMSQRKIRDWRIYTRTDLIEVDLLRQTVAIYGNITQEVGVGGGASYRARTTIDYPFIERGGEPLAMQLDHFAALLDGLFDVEAERRSILSSHFVLDQFQRAAGQ